MGLSFGVKTFTIFFVLEKFPALNYFEVLCCLGRLFYVTSFYSEDAPFSVHFLSLFPYSNPNICESLKEFERTVQTHVHSSNLVLENIHSCFNSWIYNDNRLSSARNNLCERFNVLVSLLSSVIKRSYELEMTLGNASTEMKTVKMKSIR